MKYKKKKHISQNAVEVSRHTLWGVAWHSGGVITSHVVWCGWQMAWHADLSATRWLAFVTASE